MHLRKLRIGRLPGISIPFELTAAPGLNLIYGPNGSGKTSLCQAVMGLLWPDLYGSRPLDVTGWFDDDADRWLATRQDENPVAWTRNDRSAAEPALPGRHLGRCYQLGLLDLLSRESGETDRELAREIRTQMAGGFDLDAVQQDLFAWRPRSGQNEFRRWRETTKRVNKRSARHADLDRRRDTLRTLVQRRDRAETARRRGAVLEAIRQRLAIIDELADLEARLEAFPAGCAVVQDQDAAELRNCRERLSNAAAEAEASAVAKREVEAELAATSLPSETRSGFDPRLLRQWLHRLRDLRTQVERGARELAGATAAIEISGNEAIEPVDADTYRLLSGLHARAVGHRSRIDELSERVNQDSDANNEHPRRRGLLFAGAGATAIATTIALLIVPRWTTGLPSWVLPLTLAAAAALLVGGAWQLGAASRTGRRHRRVLERALEQQRLEKQKLEQVQQELDALRRKHTLDLELAEPDLLSALKNVALRREAEDQAARHRAELDHLDSEAGNLLRRINGSLAKVGFGPAVAADEATTLVDRAEDKLAELDSLERRIADLDRDLINAQERDGVARQQLDGIVDRLALDPARELARQIDRLLAKRSAWEDANQRVGVLRSEATRVQAKIEADPVDLDPATIATLSAPDLDGLITAALEEADTLDELKETISGIRHEVRAASAGQELSEALAAEAAARYELLESRQRARDAALGSLLITGVRNQHDQGTRPPVLVRAGELFGRFTGGRYTLGVEPGAGTDSRFIARATESERDHELSELSDGTRSQLLLAVRLAFITGQETGAAPPVFLDEALTSSDPERFTAIALGLGRLARDEGRQIFYLTANPADVRAWQQILNANALPPAREVDLAAARQLAVAPLDIDLAQFAATDLAPIPAPTGVSAAEYAQILQVPRLDPWAAVNELHLFYLLSDRLPLLHRLATGGAPTLGRWDAAKAALADGGLVSGAEQIFVDIRVEIWRATLEAWRIGRTQPLHRQTLLAFKDSITSTMAPRLADHLKRYRGDAQAFMSGLENGEVKGLRADKREQLKADLIEQGILPTVSILDDNGILTRVLSSMSERLKSEELMINELRNLVKKTTRALNKAPGSMESAQ